MALGLGLGLSSVRINKSHWNYPIVLHTSTTRSSLSPLGIKTSCPLFNSISVANYSCFLPWIRTRQQITCARKKGRRGDSHQPSRKLMLLLASMVASNLNIIPEPYYSLIAEFSQRDENGNLSEFLKVLRRGFFNGRRKKKQSSGKLSWFVLVLICGMGLMCWKISEFDMFLKVSCFFLIGISVIQLWRRKAFKKWLLGSLFQISLLSCKMGKEDMKLLVEGLQLRSVTQTVTKLRNRSKRKWGKAAW